MIQTFIFTFFSSFVVTGLIIFLSRKHKSILGDTKFVGKQKFHTAIVPRVGGLGIFFSVVLGSISAIISGTLTTNFTYHILLSAIPVFFSGLIEDITKNVDQKTRLFAAVVSASIFIFTQDTWLTKTDLWFFDIIFSIPLIALFLNIIAISGIINAYNIIDGFNGLASLVAVFTLLIISYVSFKITDHELFISSIILIAAILGFFIWNYPNGLIFLGDCGAYLIGYINGILSLFLVIRNNGVSPWVFICLNSYLIIELSFSIYRKFVLRSMSPAVPDGLHLHMLIYKRIMKWGFGSNIPKNKRIRNSLTSPFLWVLYIFGSAPILLFWENSNVLIISFLVNIFIYLALYYLLLLKKFPNWLVIR